MDTSSGRHYNLQKHYHLDADQDTSTKVKCDHDIDTYILGGSSFPLALLSSVSVFNWSRAVFNESLNSFWFRCDSANNLSNDILNMDASTVILVTVRLLVDKDVDISWAWYIPSGQRQI